MGIRAGLAVKKTPGSCSQQVLFTFTFLNSIFLSLLYPCPNDREFTCLCYCHGFSFLETLESVPFDYCYRNKHKGCWNECPLCQTQVTHCRCFFWAGLRAFLVLNTFPSSSNNKALVTIKVAHSFLFLSEACGINMRVIFCLPLKSQELWVRVGQTLGLCWYSGTELLTPECGRWRKEFKVILSYILGSNLALHNLWSHSQTRKNYVCNFLSACTKPFSLSV